MSDIKTKELEIESLMKELLENSSNNKAGMKLITPEYQKKEALEKKVLKDKKATNVTNIENKPSAGGTVIHGDGNIINHPQAISFKFDDSALKAGRKKLNHRAVGERVAPEYMTPKEYTHYLCFKFGFAVGKGWNGIEDHAHMYNYEPDYNQKEFEDKDDALKYLGLYNPKAPDNLERRQNTRRADKKDIRKKKVERRNSKIRRQEERINNRVYYLSIAFLFFIIVLWAFVDVMNLVKGV